MFWVYDIKNHLKPFGQFFLELKFQRKKDRKNNKKTRKTWRVKQSMGLGPVFIAYLGLSEKCIPRRCSQTSPTNRNSGRTAYPMGWRASVGSQGSAWSLIGWPHSLHNSIDNPGTEEKMLMMERKLIQGKDISEIKLLSPLHVCTSAQKAYWYSTSDKGHLKSLAAGVSG